MNCLFLLLLLSCCGNRNNGCGCDDSRDMYYNIRRDDSECDGYYDSYDHSRHVHNHNHDHDNDYDYKHDNDCDCGCDDDRREPRIFPPFPGENCGCND